MQKIEIHDKRGVQIWISIPAEMHARLKEEAAKMCMPMTLFAKKWIIEGYKRDFGDIQRDN